MAHSAGHNSVNTTGLWCTLSNDPPVKTGNRLNASTHDYFSKSHASNFILFIILKIIVFYVTCAAIHCMIRTMLVRWCNFCFTTVHNNATWH
ncbi:hypothetical protein A9B99_00740 [Mangrovibacter phragmitis]|uniref:Uncharacterized protein n=1 Tax=Mangrovibacter phragmitis TaxID=1691903 RepID=A0A1B7L7J9_9ENTR|nr:hypothetical protein A9B99_00740 [Mangrovibacter phragmitis]